MLQGLRALISTVPGMSVVGEAQNSRDAFDQVAALNPDVVLMDIHLPGENGVEITRRVTATFPAVRVIALSSDADLRTVIDALHAGVAGYMIKRNGSDEMVRAISAVMDHHLYLSPEISSAVIRDFMRGAVQITPSRSALALTDRERLLLQLIAEGKRNKEIADAMSVTPKSAETYRFRVMRKLGCSSTAELIRYAIREGIVRP